MSREPLDAAERELADALARLPAIEPPPALDARVLAQARDALRPAIAHPRRRRPWWMGAGLGTAAAAVLAAGVAWQAGLFDVSFGSNVPVPRMPERTAPGIDAQAPVAIDLSRTPTPAAPAPPPPAEPAPPPAPPAPAAARQQNVRQATASESVPQAPRALARERTDAIHEDQRKAAAPAQAELERQTAASSPAEATLDSITVTGTRMAPDTSQILPPWREDAQLAPDAWLERIRERVRRGERNDAALSLRRFTLKHPAHGVPDELLPLLAGRP